MGNKSSIKTDVLKHISYIFRINTVRHESKQVQLILHLFSDRYVLVGSRHDNDQGSGASAIMNQLIAALTEQTKRGWVPDRTTVFCSWGGSALGNIGSYEWGKVSKHRSILLNVRVAVRSCGFLNNLSQPKCTIYRWKDPYILSHTTAPYLFIFSKAFSDMLFVWGLLSLSQMRAKK